MNQFAGKFGRTVACVLMLLFGLLSQLQESAAGPVFSPSRGVFLGGMHRSAFIVRCNNSPIQLVGLSEEPVRGYGGMGWVTWIQPVGCEGQWVGGRYARDLQVILGQLRGMGYGTMNIGMSRVGFAIEGAQLARVEPRPAPVYRTPPRSRNDDESRESPAATRPPPEKTTTAWMTATDRSSPVITINGGSISVGLYASGDCASVEGVRLEGDGGTYAFTKAGPYEVSPGRYSVVVAGRVTAGGDVCRNGRVECTIRYR